MHNYIIVLLPTGFRFQLFFHSANLSLTRLSNHEHSKRFIAGCINYFGCRRIISRFNSDYIVHLILNLRSQIQLNCNNFHCSKSTWCWSLQGHCDISIYVNLQGRLERTNARNNLTRRTLDLKWWKEATKTNAIPRQQQRLGGGSLTSSSRSHSLAVLYFALLEYRGNRPVVIIIII